MFESEEKIIAKIEKVKAMRKLKLIEFSGQNRTPRNALNLLLSNPKNTYMADNGNLQKTGRYRSITDIYRLLSFYFPDIKFHEVLQEMSSDRDIFGHYCTTILKMVVWQAYSSGNRLSGNTRTEFYCTFNELGRLTRELDI